MTKKANVWTTHARLVHSDDNMTAILASVRRY